MISRASLRTPVGQARLVALTLVAAVPFAALLGEHHAFFASFVREKYGEATAAEASAVAHVRAHAGDVPPAELELAYHCLQRDAELDAELARALAAESPDWLLHRVERTLVAGTIEQRRRALAVLSSVELPGTRAMLREVLARTQRVGPEELAPELAAACAGGP